MLVLVAAATVPHLGGVERAAVAAVLIGLLAVIGPRLGRAVSGDAPDRPGEVEHLRVELSRLEEANRILGVLNEVSRSLPTNLDLDEVVIAIRTQLATRFDARRCAILTLDEDRWHPELVESMPLVPGQVPARLPSPLDLAMLTPAVLRVDDLSEVCERSGSGLYARLIVDGFEEGLMAVEHPSPRHYDDRAAELFEGFCEIVALSIENARSFGRLRSMAASEERARIARDLHDRLGQWLTYINLELERVNGTQAEPIAELERLQDDVRSAIDELRDALVELRTKIRVDRPLAVVLPEVVQRIRERTALTVELSVPADPTARLSGLVENELLRIVQESLTNIEKHADATTVHVNWSVEGGRGILTIEDDGRGFDPGRGVRSTAYGLVGMRERAAAVGAILEITSQRGTGTVVTVLVGTTEENRT